MVMMMMMKKNNERENESDDDDHDNDDNYQLSEKIFIIMRTFIIIGMIRVEKEKQMNMMMTTMIRMMMRN